jgi:hypothetical protein
MNLDNLKQEIAKYKWFHKIDFGYGVVTPGIDDTPRKLKSIGLPDDLRGVTVAAIDLAASRWNWQPRR